MTTSIYFKSIYRTSIVILVALAALAFASSAHAEERDPEPDYCAQHGNPYFGYNGATEDIVDSRVGHGNWQVGQHYLLGEEILDNGLVLQFWIHIISVDEYGHYDFIEYYYLPHCDRGPVYGHFDDLLFDPFVNPKLEVIGVSRIAAMGQPINTDAVVDGELEEDDDNGYPPDPVEPSSAGSSQGVVLDEDGDDSGPVIFVTEHADDTFLVPIPVPVVP